MRQAARDRPVPKKTVKTGANIIVFRSIFYNAHFAHAFPISPLLTRSPVNTLMVSPEAHAGTQIYANQGERCDRGASSPSKSGSNFCQIFAEDPDISNVSLDVDRSLTQATAIDDRGLNRCELSR